MAVSKRLRYEVLRRDNHACRYCGATAPEARLTVDHVVPTALGGTDEPSNLVTACSDCNSGKAASAPDAPLVADVEADSLRWAAAMARAAEAQAKDRDFVRQVLAWFDEIWLDWHTDFDGSPIPRPVGWQDSIERFHSLLLDLNVIEEALQIAMRSKTPAERKWRYFCGICWRRIDEIRENARALIDAEEMEGPRGS